MATQTATPKTDNPLRADQVLITPNFAEAQYRRTVHFAEASHLVTPKDIIKPEYWAHVAPLLRARDRVEVYSEDGTWYAELMVTFVPEKSVTKPQNWASVKLMRLVDLAKDEDVKELPKGFTSKFLNPNQRWGIIRASDGSVVVDKKPSQKEAVDEFFRLQKQMAA